MSRKTQQVNPKATLRAKLRPAPATKGRNAPRLAALVHASELLTGAGIRAKDGRRSQEADIGSISDGAIIYEHGPAGKIVWVGETSKIPAEFRSLIRGRTRDLGLKQAVVPGWVDCHNHLVFGGDRASEFAARCAGETYQEIAARGGGIIATVRATRQASLEQLVREGERRLAELVSYGVRVVEIKSGYGLDLKTELKLLQAATTLQKRHPDLLIRRTYLGAHAVPAGIDRQNYVDQIVETHLPEVARRKLADACDIFVDQGYFDLDDAREVLGAAKDLGLDVKVHADELGDTGSAALACELGALSADHLLKVNRQGIEALARSNTVAVLLPGTAFYLKADHAPARDLIDAGACVALATDFNPGTCMCLSLPVIMTTAALYLKMTRAEILAAVTYNAAKALGVHNECGTLEPGRRALITELPFERFEESYYRFAWSPTHAPST